MHSIVISQDESDTVYDLTTVEAVNEELGIEGDTASDAATANQITSFSKLIGEICDRIFAQRAVVETFYLHEHYIHALALKHYPVSEIASVVAGGQTLTATDYKVDPESGLLWRWSGSGCCGWRCGEVVVTYTGGYDLPSGAPASLAQACIEMIEDSSTAGAGAGGLGGTVIRDIQHGDRRISYFDASASASSTNPSLTASVADLIRPFKRIPA